MTYGYAADINSHYGLAGLAERVDAELTKLGKDLSNLTVDDLAPLDEFHTGGRASTIQLAERLRLAPGTTVLDLGGGIGGPARTLASRYGCDVTVLDLTEEFCQVGEALTRRLGLEDHVRFRHGNALALPFEAGSFDVVWAQNCFMNIEDKKTLFSSIYRVLRPGGFLGFQDAMAGEAQPLVFPVAWADSEEISFLRPPDVTKRQVTDAGFVTVAWEDVTQEALEAAERREAARERGEASNAPRLLLFLIRADDAPERRMNGLRNLREGRLLWVQAVFQKR